MAFDGGLTGMGFPVPMDSNMTDLGKLEEMQKQFVDSLEAAAQQMGLNPEQVRSDAEHLAPFQPMMDFVEKWQGEDGLWAGDPIQRSEEYMSALAEANQRAMGGLLSTFMFASEQPPWDQPRTMAIMDGSAFAEQFGLQEAPAGTQLEGYWQETLPDGSVGFVTGVDPYWAQGNLDWVQGDEVPGFTGTCGLTSVANIAQMYGVELTEGQVVEFAAANGLCATGYMDPGMNGGTSPGTSALLLTEAGIPAHVETGNSLDDLIGYVEEGRGIELSVNAGLLWGDGDPRSYGDGGTNHAISLTGVVKDSSGEVTGLVVCDSSGPSPAPLHFVSAERMQEAWANIGGVCVVADVPRSQGYPPGVAPVQYA